LERIGVLYLMPWLIVGGAENQVVQSLRFIDRKKFRPVVCCIRETGALFGEVQELGITSYCLNMRPKYGLSVLKALSRITEIIQREEIQVVQAMEFNARVLGAVAARLSGVPVNVAAEHYTGEWQEPWFKKVVKRMTATLVDRIICVAEAQKNHLIEDRGIPAEKIEVIYNGIDLGKFDPRAEVKVRKSDFSVPEQSPVVGIVAALRPEKAHHVFLEAAKRISSEVENAYFLIVGDGQRRSELEELSKKLGIADRTIFTGVRNDIPEILAIMDVVVLSSYPVVETFPVSLLEAMAMENPIVSTNVSGIPEMVEDGKNGFLVSVGDSDALAASVTKLLQDRKLAEKMGKSGRKLVEGRFTIQKTVRSLEDFYIRLLESKSSKRRKNVTGNYLSRKTILHLTHGRTYSGGEHSLYLLYKYMDRNKFEPVVVCLEDGLLRRRLNELGIKVHCLGTRARIPIHILPRIMSIARAENADLIINQTTRMTIIGRFASLLTGRLNITIVQAPILRDTNTRKPRWINYCIERLTGFISNRHIVVNKAMRKEMIDWGRSSDSIKAIYNSVDPEYLDYVPKNTIFKNEFSMNAGRPSAGMIASFRPRKGAEYLINAMPAVLEKIPDAVLFMIGHGEWVRGKDYIEELKELAVSNGVSDSIIFTGFRSDIPQIVSELDVLILPSVYGEGSSLTILEAMGLGCPVIATATEGNIELIDDRITGLLVPPADALSLSEAIISLLEDREQARKMGNAAKQRVSREFLADRMAAEYSELFQEIFEKDQQRKLM
jgi:glycosyltransferase involved in cell wall biosynthesis